MTLRASHILRFVKSHDILFSVLMIAGEELAVNKDFDFIF